MSAAQIALSGLPRSEALKPADTNEATLLATGDNGAVLLQLVIANNTGSAADATVKWSDGTTDWDIVSGKAIAANDSEIIDAVIRLPSDGALKVTSGTGGALTFTATVVEFVGGYSR